MGGYIILLEFCNTGIGLQKWMKNLIQNLITVSLRIEIVLDDNESSSVTATYPPPPTHTFVIFHSAGISKPFLFLQICDQQHECNGQAHRLINCSILGLIWIHDQGIISA